MPRLWRLADDDTKSDKNEPQFALMILPKKFLHLETENEDPHDESHHRQKPPKRQKEGHEKQRKDNLEGQLAAKNPH
jgi:hypothetical protein